MLWPAFSLSESIPRSERHHITAHMISGCRLLLAWVGSGLAFSLSGSACSGAGKVLASCRATRGLGRFQRRAAAPDFLHPSVKCVTHGEHLRVFRRAILT